MKTPTISIVMAVYNGQDSVVATIKSMLAQTCGDFEFVIVNDASTDATGEVIDSFDDARIVVHTNETNIGQTASLNVGLAMARGTFIARTDCGDSSMPDRLARQLKFMTKAQGEQYAALGTAGVMVDTDGARIGIARRPAKFRDVLMHMFHVSPLIHISVLARRDIILDLGGYDEQFHIAADHELWSKLIRSRHRITSLPQALVKWEIDTASLSHVHLGGKVTDEAGLIIKRNAAELAGIDISDEDARRIFAMFTFGLQSLGQRDRDIAEAIFKDICARLAERLCGQITPRRVGGHLARNYLKLALGLMAQGKNAQARNVLKICISKHGPHPACIALLPATFMGKTLSAAIAKTRKRTGLKK